MVLDRKVLQVVVERPDKEPLVATFGGIPFERNPDGMGVVDFSPELAWHRPANKRSDVVQRLLVGKCELCGVTDEPVQVHHIRKLADIDRPGRRPKADWEKIMSARKRKTLVVCEDCHQGDPRRPLRWTRVMNGSLESRMRRKVQVRFGGGRLETCDSR